MAERPPELLRMAPMNAMQLLDACVRIYRENFFLFVGISMLPTVPVHLLSVVGVLFHTKALHAIQTPGAAVDSEQMLAIFSMLGTTLIFLVLQQGIGVPIATGALTTAVSQRYLGQPVTLGASFRPIFRHLWPYLMTSMLVALVLGLSAMCTCWLLLPFAWTWFMCTPCVQVLEGTQGINAMARSRELARGHGLRIFGASLWMFTVYTVLQGVLPWAVASVAVSQVESPVLHVALHSSIAIVIGATLDPFWSILRIMFYYDLRIRKEGYDLAINGQRLAAVSPLE